METVVVAVAVTVDTITTLLGIPGTRTFGVRAG
jgi:hypothetical protein